MSDSLILAITTNQQNITHLTEQIATIPFQLEVVRSLTELAPESAVVRNAPGEPVAGYDARIYAALVARQPVLILFDFDQDAVSWQKWIPIIKASPATRRIPIVGYTVDFSGDLRRKSKGHGTDLLVPAERFWADLPQLITKMARTHDTEAMQNASKEPLAADAIKGIELFNRGEYYAAHDGLEIAWKADASAVRELYRGILQVAIAYMQIERGNYNGAVKMLQRVKQWLDPLPDVCRGVDVAQLRVDSSAVYEELLRLSRERMGELDHTLLKPVKYDKNL